jgi:hypothetical protein
MNIATPIDWIDEDLAASVGASWTTLPAAEQLMIWSIRHMLVCWPSCGPVRAALHAAYGDEALGVEHLLRCFLTGIGARATRALTVGDPTCAPLLADEDAMLFILRSAHREPTAAGAALAELCAQPHAAALLPLAAALAEVAGLSGRA